MDAVVAALKEVNGWGGVGGDDERNVAGVVNTRVVLLFLFCILFLYILL